MSDLARQQCFNHSGREAIVRCPSCQRDYCRECVSEYDDRYLCSACLRLQAARETPTPRRMRMPVGAFLGLLGLLSAWTVYYGATEFLTIRNGSDHAYRVWHAR